MRNESVALKNQRNPQPKLYPLSVIRLPHGVLAWCADSEFNLTGTTTSAYHMALERQTIRNMWPSWLLSRLGSFRVEVVVNFSQWRD